MRKLGFLLFFCFSLQAIADDYKIIQMNSSSVKIGNVQCKIGDIFSDEDQIYWSNEKQVIKTMNLRSKQIRIFVAKTFTSSNSKSIKDYFLKNNHLSTRGGATSFSDLADELQETVYLYDLVAIDSPVELDSHSCYVISYGDEVKRWATLMSKDSTFYLSRELFDEADSKEEYTLSLYFRRKDLAKDYLVTDELHVVLLPLQLNE